MRELFPTASKDVVQKLLISHNGDMEKTIQALADGEPHYAFHRYA